MTKQQKLLDELSAILVKTPEFERKSVIKRFCERNGISLERKKRKKFDKKSIQELPFKYASP